MRGKLVQHGNQLQRFLVAGLGLFAVALDRLFHRGQVGQRQFGDDGFDVGQRIDLARHVHYVGIVEAAHHIHNGVGLADVGQELVAQAFALGCARHQARDVDEFDDGVLHALRVNDFRQFIETRVGHLDDADIGLDGAERVILRRNAGLGQRIEHGGLADVGQTDDTAFQTHVYSLKLTAVQLQHRRLQLAFHDQRRHVLRALQRLVDQRLFFLAWRFQHVVDDFAALARMADTDA